MKKAILFLLVILLVTTFGFSQQKQIQSNTISFTSIKHNSYIRCVTMEMDSINRVNHPEFGSFNSNAQFINQAIKKHKAKYTDNLQQKLPILVIPVVIHVIHNGDPLGSGENILDGQAISQIQILNEDFRRILGTPGYNTNIVGADVEIEFCLAVVDPAGNVTTGVNHVNTGVTSYNSNSSVETMKTNTIWDPTQYMNMWTVKFGGSMGGTLGYAQFPSNSGLSGLATNGGAANTDGVVASYDAMGSSAIFTVAQGGIYNPTYNLGRTMTHEVGHWLGLRHIWGDGGCGVDDFCADTPNSDGSNFGCSNPPSCGSPDMVENYMDYTDDNCMNIFTLDQKSRIRQVMLNSPRRMELSNSTKCTSPNADDAGISIITEPGGSYCNVTSLDPIVTLNNYGSNNLTSIGIVYDIDGGVSSTYNWTGTLTPGSSVSVTLPTINVVAGVHTFNVSTNLPNGNVDANMGNDGTSSNFTIVMGNPVDLSISTDCFGYETYWELLDATNTLVYSGGNTGTTIPPGGGGTATAGDVGAYPNQTTVSGTLCLVDGCYDFIIYDDFGDGLEGIATGNCAINGTYSLIDPVTTSVLASYTVFTNSQTTNFCIGNNCTSDAGTMNITPLSICGNGNQTAIHNGDQVDDGNDALQFVLHDGSGSTLGNIFNTATAATFGFVGGMNYGTTYYISAIVGDDLGGNVVDQTDGCLSISIGTPAVWYDLPTVVANTSVAIICSGDPVTLVGSGANAYVWTNGVVDGTAFNPTSTNNYTVIGTDVNGCTNTDVVSVTVNTLPNVIANATNTVVCIGSPVILTGSGASTYTWNNNVVDGVTFSPSSTNNYTVTGTDVNGCTNTDIVSVTVNTLPIVTANVTNAIVCSGSPVILTGNGANTYTWNNSVVDGVAFSPLLTNSYIVTGTDANGCSSTDNVMVTVNSSPTFSVNSTNSICGGDNGIITISGLSNSSLYELTYTNGVVTGPINTMSDGAGQINLTNLVDGSYTDITIGLNGCSTVYNTPIVLISPLQVSLSTSIEDENCSNSNGEIEIVATGGSGIYQYSIDNGMTFGAGNVFTGLGAGIYNIVVLDNNNCQAIVQVNLINNIEPSITNVTATNVSCYGETNGSLVVTASGSTPLNYSNNGGVSQSSGIFNGLITGTYTIVVTDNNGCSVSQSNTVTAPAELICTTTVINSYCGNENGSIALVITGGTGGYVVSWEFDVTETNDTIYSLNSGNYNYTITDDIGCTFLGSEYIDGSTSLEIEIVTKNESCEGEKDGIAEVSSIIGGMPTYSYMWDNGENTAAINELEANIYQVKVTDLTGCSALRTIVISVESDECLDIYNAISPNGDGDNDTWVVTGIKGKENASVQIYNRWGSLIYESFDYQNDWDGTYKNKDLPAGVYYYLVTITEGEVYKGSLTILR